VERSQGLSRAGRGQVRGIMIQAAWLWLKHQPKSAITRWSVQRTAGQSRRIQRITLIAVARKLAIALWRFFELGLVPQGAMLATR
jgi:transposase